MTEKYKDWLDQNYRLVQVEQPLRVCRHISLAVLVLQDRYSESVWRIQIILCAVDLHLFVYETHPMPLLPPLESALLRLLVLKIGSTFCGSKLDTTL